MKLEGTAIEELKAIYEEEFSAKIDNKKAQSIAIKLLSLYGLCIKSGPKNDVVQKS